MATYRPTREGMYAVDFGRWSNRTFSLPPEVSSMIFSQLDERSLTRCAFVCTSWYSSISMEKTLWLHYLEKLTRLPPHIIKSAVEQYRVTVSKSVKNRSERVCAQSQPSTGEVDEESIESKVGQRVSGNILQLALVQHRGVLHNVFSSLRWLNKEGPVEHKAGAARRITLEASGKTPQKVGRRTVLLKDSPTGPFTFYQLDSTSSQLVQKEYEMRAILILALMLWNFSQKWGKRVLPLLN